MATILIVDDHEANRELLTTLLGYRNHQTVEARDGAEGLERARAVRPDLIITDILMPTMDGYEFTHNLREDPALALIPVIFYSAHYLMHEARALAERCRVDYVVSKPVEPQELMRTVDAALGLAPVVAAPPPVEEFDREHIRVLTNKLSTQAEEVQNLNARLEALIEIGHELNVAQDPSELVERYCRAAREVIGAMCASACITDESGRAVHRFCSGGVKPTDAGNPCPTCELHTPVAEVLESGECRRGRTWPGGAVTLGCAPGLGGVDSYLVAPVLTGTRTYGWIGLGNKLGDAGFSAEDERLLTTLAAQLAMGYENSRLFKEAKQRAEELEAEVAERRRSAEKYRMVVEQASDGIIIADPGGNFIEVNSRMLEMLGYTRAQFLALNLRDLVPTGDQSLDPVRLDLLRSGKVVRKERRFIRSDGSLMDVELGITALEDGGIQAIVRDVSERNRLETQLRQSQKLEAVGRLAGGVAHDFNNLLTVILGHSDLAITTLDPHDRLRRDLEDIRDAGTRAAMLTHQLLAFSRKQLIQPKVLNLNTALANVTKMLGRLISSNIEIVTRCDADAWSAKVDPGQLDQVILNLALNARDAMPLGGKLLIETANRRFEAEQISGKGQIPPGHYVMLAVSDTGSGMDAETQSHLFEPFFTTKMQGKGTGLGLPTVYGIVRQSGGHIAVYSEPSHGTSVKVYLPRAAEAADTTALHEDTAPLPVGTETILIAEDEDRVRSLAAAVLAQQGYNVIEACDGQEALAKAREHGSEIHLLLTDIVMPKLSGMDLADQLRRDRPGIQVLLSSGYTGDTVMQQGGLDAATPFLQKPFTVRTLALKVREVLDVAAGGTLSKGMKRETAKEGGSRYSHPA
ncbi:MAG: response regulator [Acidobacteriia bacterium]|nr:response regulator [Terriglobia bacterium]